MPYIFVYKPYIYSYINSVPTSFSLYTTNPISTESIFKKKKKKWIWGLNHLFVWTWLWINYFYLIKCLYRTFSMYHGVFVPIYVCARQANTSKKRIYAKNFNCEMYLVRWIFIIIGYSWCLSIHKYILVCIYCKRYSSIQKDV